MGKAFISKIGSEEINLESTVRTVTNHSSIINYITNFAVVLKDYIQTGTWSAYIKQKIELTIINISMLYKLNSTISIPKIAIEADLFINRIFRATVIIPNRIIFVKNKIKISKTVKDTNIVFRSFITIVYNYILKMDAVTILFPGILTNATATLYKYNLVSDFDDNYLNVMDGSYLEDLDYTIT